jgi:hypothetical protein
MELKLLKLLTPSESPVYRLKQKIYWLRWSLLLRINFEGLLVYTTFVLLKSP